MASTHEVSVTMPFHSASSEYQFQFTSTRSLSQQLQKQPNQHLGSKGLMKKSPTRWTSNVRLRRKQRAATNMRPVKDVSNPILKSCRYIVRQHRKRTKHTQCPEAASWRVSIDAEDTGDIESQRPSNSPLALGLALGDHWGTQHCPDELITTLGQDMLLQRCIEDMFRSIDRDLNLTGTEDSPDELRPTLEQDLLPQQRRMLPQQRWMLPQQRWMKDMFETDLKIFGTEVCCDELRPTLEEDAFLQRCIEDMFESIDRDLNLSFVPTPPQLHHLLPEGPARTLTERVTQNALVGQIERPGVRGLSNHEKEDVCSFLLKSPFSEPKASSSVEQPENWRGPAFMNSPHPRTLPFPKFLLSGAINSPHPSTLVPFPM